MSEYLIINILIILFPFLFSFEKKVKFIKKLKYVFAANLVVTPIFLIWDFIATARGDWFFNKEHILNYYLLNLPLEEVLFFITVSFSCLFIYEVLKYYLKEAIFSFNIYLFYLIIILVSVFVIINIAKYYTFTIGIIFIVSLVLLKLFDTLKSKIFWITIILTYIPFLIVNYILTSIPIVQYSSNAILNIRFLTIPIEDFFYSFSLISCYIISYNYFYQKWIIKKV